MQCGRCGEHFEGRFCPRCGASGTEAFAEPRTDGNVCGRCGTTFAGNFCPRCGLPAAYSPPASATPTTGRSILSVAWTLAIAGFLVLAALSFAGLLLAPSLVVPGIQGMQQGTTVNGDLDISTSNWTFTSLLPGASGTRGGSLEDGYLEMSAPAASGAGVIGYWSQSFLVTGSRPYAARVQLEVKVDLGSSVTAGTFYAFVEPSAGLPSRDRAVGIVPFTEPSDWVRTTRFVADDRLAGPGVYHLILAFETEGSGPGSPTVVGFDDIRLLWATDAGLVFYVVLPLPAVFFVSRDATIFLGYYLLVAGLLLSFGAYHAIRDRRATTASLMAPSDALDTRLRSRSAWLAVAQVWMAFTFFQLAVILVMEASGLLPTDPFDLDANNMWVFLYEVMNGAVYEEFAFRLLLIGAPMALGSLVLRILEVNRSGGTWRGRVTPGRHIAGSLRYLTGGVVRRSSSKETLLASWALLVASSALFGLAHLPGWGLWKVFPSFVGGLAFGYLFLRHGVAAAILAHFVNNYAFSLIWMGTGGLGMTLLIGLLYWALAIAGAGFFLWYAVYAWGLLRELRARYARTPLGSSPRPAPRAPLNSMPYPPPRPYPGQPSPAPPPPPPLTREEFQLPSGYTPSYRPPPYGYPPVRFQCPTCGWVEARYDEGRFTCARCGKTS